MKKVKTWEAELRNGRWVLVQHPNNVYFAAASLSSFEARMIAKKLNRLEDIVEIAWGR